jgi:hypothetical protein
MHGFMANEKWVNFRICHSKIHVLAGVNDADKRSIVGYVLERAGMTRTVSSRDISPWGRYSVSAQPPGKKLFLAWRVAIPRQRFT